MTTAIEADFGHFPLLPRHGVKLHAPDGGGARFAQLFRETWRRLPLYARRRILALWREPVDDRGQGIRPPADSVERRLEIEVAWRGAQGDWACCRDRGHTIYFWTEFVSAIPDDLVPDLIAHELAHVHQWACGHDLASGLAQTRMGWVEFGTLEIEIDADEQADDWGSSSTALEDWCVEHGVLEILEPISENILMVFEGILRDGR